jgi:O-methyltransferase
MILKNIIKNKIQKFAYSRGYEIFRIGVDITNRDMEIIHAAKPYTVTDTSAMKSLIDSVRYIIDNNISGSFVECGVWRGGSIMIIIKVLQQMGIKDRTIHLFDTFEGLNIPTEYDVRESGEVASQLDYKKFGKDSQVKIDSVIQRINNTKYPKDKIIFHKGEVEKTLPKIIVDDIALLRLDTDWYESTKVEMEYLYPKLVHRGILIIDDYGIWKGAKKAVDEYFNKNNLHPFLSRINTVGVRLLVKSFNNISNKNQN